MAYIPPNPNGQATSANSAPVTIASDQSALPVDSSKVEDTAHSSGATGSYILGVRQDADTSPASDGDYHGLIFNAFGRLKASILPAYTAATTGNITANGQTVSCDVQREASATLYCTGTFSTVNVTFEASIDGGTTWFGIQAARTNANTVETTSGNLSAAPAYAWKVSCTAYTHIRVRATAFTSGTQVWTIQPGALAADPAPTTQSHAVTMTSTTLTSVIPTTAATALGKAVDAAAGATDTGVAALVQRFDTPTTLTPATGDYVIPRTDALGKLWTAQTQTEDVAHATGDRGAFVLGVANEAQTTLAADGDYIGQATDVKGNTLNVGNLAHDAVDAGAPLKVGGQARTTNPTSVADADRVNAIFDKTGRQVVITNHVREMVAQNVVTLTASTTETTLLAAGAAGVFHDLTYLKLTNSSATGVLVTIRDATAGTAVDFWYVPPTTTMGGVLQVPFKQTTAANNWTIQCGASVSSLYATVQAVKNL